MKSKLTNFLSLAVVILVLAALFTVSAFAEISGDFGKIVGLDSTKTYEAAPATINAAGNALAIGEYSDVSASTTGLAGLYYVREKGTTENGTLVYVYGKFADRQKIGTFEGTSTKPLAGKVPASTTFTPGKFLTSTGFVAVSVDPSKTAAGSSSTVGSWGFHQQYFRPDKNDQLVKDVVEADKALADLKAAAEPDQTAIDAAQVTATAKRQALADQLKTVYMSYALASDEIIPASQLTSLKYGVNSMQGNVGYYKPSVVFYTVNSQGAIKTYTWNSSSRIQAHYAALVKHVVVDAAATLAEAADDEYVVALRFLPWGNISADTVYIHNPKLDNTYNADSQVMHFFWHNAYTIKRPVAPTPTGLTVNGKTVSGLQADKTYVAVPMTAIGQDTANQITIPAGATSYTFPETAVGLWAIAVKGDGVEYDNSDVGQILYFNGKVADRKAIFEGTEGQFPTSASGSNFVLGTLVSSSSFEARYASGNCLITYGGIFDTYKNSSTATEQQRKTEFESRINKLQTTKISYAFTSKEIIPISEVTKYSWAMSQRYSSLSYKGLVSKFVAHVILPNGEKKTYEYLHTAADYDSGYASSENTRNLYATGKFTRTVDFTQKTSSFGSWTEELPADGYLVGFEIYPTYGMTDFTKTSKGGTTAWLATFSLIMNFSSSKYEIVTPKAPTPTGLTVNGKTVSGLDANMSYVAVPMTAIGQDTANQITIPAGATSYTFPETAVGLWAIAVKGDGEYYNNSDVGDILYFEGKYPGRQNIGEIESGATLPKYVSGSSFVLGSFSIPEIYAANCSASSTAYTYYSQSQGTAHRDQKVKNVCTTRATYNNLVASGTAKDVEIQTALDAFNAAKQTLVNAITKAPSMVYAYTSDEIIPTTEAVQMKFNFTIVQGPIDVASPSVTFAVMNSKGELKEYVWKAAQKGNTQTIDLTTVLPQTEGNYLVGFKAYANGALTADTLTFFSDTYDKGGDNYRNSAIHYKISFYFNDYEIIVDKAPTPTGITVNEETVSGFDSNYDYVAVPITINGADNSKAQDITPVDGKYVFDAATMPGLWGVAIKGDGEYYMNSDTSAPFYIKGSAEARQKIGTFASGSNYPTFASGNNYVEGKFIGAGIGHPVYSQGTSNGAYGNLAQYVPYSDDGYRLWAYQHTKAEAEAALAAAKESNKKECTGLASDIEAFYTDAFLAKDAGTVAAELLALQQKIKSIIQPLTYYYGYASDEIINVSELLNFKIGFKKQQGSVQIPDVQARISFAVMDATGAVTEYSTLTDPYSIINNTDSVTFNIDVQSISGLPAEGWIVGFKVEPYAVVDETKMVGVVSFPADERGREFRFNQTQQVFYFYYGAKAYAIKQDAPTPELSTFPVIGGGFGQISGLNRDYLYEYKYSADGTTWPDNWSEIPANSTALNVTDAGYYKVRAKDTTAYGKSDVVEIRVIEYEGALDELPYTEPIAKMYLPNDFVELQAEYEIDVTVKNWIATIALQNISTVSPDSTLKINGKNHKFVVKASDIEVDETVHYYNMAVSLFGESRHNVNLEKFKALAGDTYLTDIYFESSKPLPFKNAELNVYLGTEYEGMDVELNLYNEKINRLRSVEVSSVYEGWATFTNCAETYVVVIPD